MAVATPFHDLRQHYEHLKGDIDEAIRRVLVDGQAILGSAVAQFEHDFARYVGAQHAIGVASGTDAVRLALEAAGVRPGDIVVTVANAGVPPVAAIRAIDARPWFVDVDPLTGCLDPTQLQAINDSAIRALLVVHLYGHAADMDRIMPLARARGWKVIEDCAHAHGGRYRDRHVGTFGDAGAFSFYPTKNLGAFGDGGMVVTNVAALADDVRMRRSYGWDENRISHIATSHSRLDEIQAAILVAKLPRLDGWIEQRRRLASHYCARLPNDVRMPTEQSWVRHAYHLFSIRTAHRDRLREALAAVGIGTGIHYAPPVYRHPAYRDCAPASPLPTTEHFARSSLSLPLYPELDIERVDWIATEVQRCLSNIAKQS